MKTQALEIMLKEMEQQHTPAEDRLHNWLCDQTEDAELMAGICKQGKSIKQAMQYCMTEAKKQAVNGSAMVDDATVFGWVRTYFVTDDIEVEQVQGKVATSSENEPKAQPKGKAQEEPKKPNEELEQMNLFDFLE